MSKADEQWNELATKVINEGFDQYPEQVETWYVSDDKPATARFTTGYTFEFNEGESALMEGKNINIEKPTGEIFWIMQDKSNDLNLLYYKYGISFWDPWDDGNRTIGKAYGWQVANKKQSVPFDEVNPAYLKVPYIPEGDFYQLDQMDNLIQGLLEKPYSRRHVISLWDTGMNDEMSLPPCVWNTTWIVTPDRRLHLEAMARSSDIALGLPFNLYQYQVLQHSIARSTGLIPGGYRFHTANPHIYDRHIEGVQKIIDRGIGYRGEDEPRIVINENIDKFYDLRVSDISVESYNPEPGVKFDIAKHTRDTTSPLKPLATGLTNMTNAIGDTFKTFFK